MNPQLIIEQATRADQAVFALAMLLILAAAHILAGTDWKRETEDLRNIFKPYDRS